MNKTKQVLKYISLDFLGSCIAWALFFFYRKTKVELIKLDLQSILNDSNFLNGILGISLLWILIYSLLGNYRNIYRKSRLIEFGKTILQHFVGVSIIFIFFLSDDVITEFSQYYSSTIVYFLLQTAIVYFLRFLLLTVTNRRVHRKEIGFPTLLIGSQNQAVELYLKIENLHRSSGNKFIGFVSPTMGQKTDENSRIFNYLPEIGSIDELDIIIQKHQIEEVIIATENHEQKLVSDLLEKLEDEKVMVKVLPTLYDILTGSVKMTSLFGVPLLHIHFEYLPIWQSILKRIIDVVVSIGVLILASPLYIISSILVKLSSKGPIFYLQERIGINGKPFNIIKFRSMYVDAEKFGPQLSADLDPRITPWGRIMRKYRIDEFPQFYNVLIGDMSLVGPRPERQFYIDQLLERAAYYKQIHRVKPGITSWGMVKFGYAENIEEMLERLKFDLIYIENLSLLSDFKVLVYTVVIVFQGRGK
ncbi:MAG: sugar transferase [Flavobacteriales bacterium]